MYPQRIAALRADRDSMRAHGWHPDDVTQLAARIRALAVITGRTIESVEREVFTQDERVA